MLAPDGQAACIFKVCGAPNATLGIATVAAAAAPVAAAPLELRAGNPSGVMTAGAIIENKNGKPFAKSAIFLELLDL